MSNVVQFNRSAIPKFGQLELPPPEATCRAVSTMDGDPAFNLIEAHRKAHALHMYSLELQNRFERMHGHGRGSWVSERACRDEDRVFTELVAVPATTLAGLIAKLNYLRELSSEFETEWMISQRAEAAVLIESLTTSLNLIMPQPPTRP